MRPRSFNRRHLVSGLLGAGACALAAGADAFASPALRLVRQGSYGNPTSLGSSGRASAINGDGQVAGLFGSTAALWEAQSGQYIDLGTWPGDSASEAFAINEGGVVVGVSWSSSYQPHGVVWSQGQAFDLGTLSGGTESMALAINNNDQVVGWSDAPDGAHHAVLWDLVKGQMHDLRTGDGDFAEATGINDGNEIAGWIEDMSSTRFAVKIDQDGGYTALGGQSIALAINAAGQVAGVVRASDGNDHAMLWDGQMYALGSSESSGQATAISDQGLVVGSVVLNGTDVAAYWDASTLDGFRLDGLASGSTVAYGVNGAGWIVGESGGQPVLWTLM